MGDKIDKLLEFGWQVIAKAISVGGTLTLTYGGYTATVFFGEVLKIQIPDATADAIVKGVIGLLFGATLWKFGVVENIKGTQAVKNTKAKGFVEEKSAFDLF